VKHLPEDPSYAGASTEPDAATNAAAKEVIDAAFEVHRHLGPAFLEGVYENALCHELSLRAIAFDRQAIVSVTYKGAIVGEGRADLIVRQRLVVELKALPAPVHTAQVISYLKATRISLGLLINFGERHFRTGCRRIVLTQ